MAEQEHRAVPIESITLPYRPGEFQEVAERLGRLSDSLVQYPTLNFATQEMRGAAAALSRAEGLLSDSAPTPASAIPVEQQEPEAVQAQGAGGSSDSVATAAEGAPETAGKPEVGTRWEWAGNVGRQPEFTRVKDGRLRGEFYLAQHPDPTDRETTEWLRCYNLDRHAEALQKKGRLAGAEVVVRGSFQGVRTLQRRDGTTVEQPTIYVYGVRIVKGPKTGPGLKQ